MDVCPTSIQDGVTHGRRNAIHRDFSHRLDAEGVGGLERLHEGNLHGRHFVGGENVVIGQVPFKRAALARATEASEDDPAEGERDLAARGFKVVADEVYSPKDTDMTPQLTKIRSIKPDAIIAWALNPGMAIIAKSVKQLDIKVPLYMSHGTSTNKFIELAGEAADGVVHPAGKMAIFDSLPKSDPQAKLLKDYYLEYKKLYGEEATTFGGFAYDAFRLIASAVEKGNTTPEQIRNGIEQTKKLASVSGIFTMTPKDHNGLDLSSLVMVKITKGKWTMLTK